ncbi:MAG: hypothetical protein GTO63_32230 [Anaerolineae bacterium]|nr:hypothetical protein [Anaerolineae bacterium]NIN99320.1 hypothetical protein [Anaerolineae bacterium]NIQ82185.1 hypothetical protein [Anaerolineae bacterium]
MRNRPRTLCVIGALAALLLWAIPTHAQEPEEGQCWACHRQPNLNAVAGVQAANALCFDCHREPDTVKEVLGQEIPLQVEEEDYARTRHGHVACTQCHSTVARSPHEERAESACSDCHRNLSRHIAAGESHLTVDCAACHFQIDHVVRDSETRQVELGRFDVQRQPLDKTGHRLSNPVPCDRCHVAGNRVGAPNGALPAKGLLCFACHDASPVLLGGRLLGAGPTARTDWVSLAALSVFGLGLAVTASVWLRGTVRGKTGLSWGEKLSYLVADACRLIFSRRVFTLLKHLVLDGILLRRSLRDRVSRWFIHGLMLWPFLARCLLGILTWGMAQFWPTASLTRTLVDKNAPPVAFLYDFLACLIILGALLALSRRALDPEMRRITSSADVAFTAILGGVFVVGFVVEGARLLVTGVPFEQAIYSFAGYLTSRFLVLLPFDWASAYASLWWSHAALAGALIAYLPFSKFLHVVVSPLAVTVSQIQKEKP